MTEKEIAELRRRVRPDKTSITHVRGCYVNEQGEIVAAFDQALGQMTEEDSEQVLTLLRKTLTGTQGKNLLEITFDTAQVTDGEEHKRLMKLRETGLKDEETVSNFYDKIIRTLPPEANHLILLAQDVYDVPYRAQDGARQEDASEQVFAHILCAICPVKQTRPALGYYPKHNEMRGRPLDWVVSAPEIGFLFPAFDERRTNLYNALYYARDAATSHTDFVEAVFHQTHPMSARAQKEAFQDLLGDVLGEESSLQIVEAVQEQLCVLIDLAKSDKEAPPMMLSKQEMGQLLQDCGVPQDCGDTFDAQYDATFGANTTLSPRNLVEKKGLAVCTSDVTVQVSNEGTNRVQTRIIDGVKYLLIRADEEVEVNGVRIQIN